MKNLSIVVAANLNNVIGKDNGIPWDLPEDRKHFVNVTRGHAIIMGRKTWDSIGRPLPKRRNIVVSRNYDLRLPDGVEMTTSLLGAIALARTTDDDPRIIGGAQIYAEALPLASTVYLTRVLDHQDGDTYFPELDLALWECSDPIQTELATYYTYQRV